MNKIYRYTKLTGKHNGDKDKKQTCSVTLMGYQGTAGKRDFAADSDANMRVQDVGWPAVLCKLMDWGGGGNWEGTKGR